MFRACLRVSQTDHTFAPSVILLFFCSLFVSLGIWQLHRMEKKKDTEQALLDRQVLAPLFLGESESRLIEQNFSGFQYRRLSIRGVFLGQYTVLLDNQVLNKHVGYRVLTPFLPQGCSKMLWVDRGFIPAPANRDTLPTIPTPSEEMGFTGILHQINPGLILKDESLDLTESWPLRVQSIDYRTLSKRIHHPVFHFLIQMPADNPHAFETPPLHIGISSKKHLGYAVQWFTMAFATLVYTLIVKLRHRSCKNITP